MEPVYLKCYPIDLYSDRECFSHSKTLIKYRIMNESWYILKYKNSECVIYIKANNDILDEAVYISPIISNLISYDNNEQQCILKDIFSIPKNKIKFKYSIDTNNLNNLPTVKKLYLLRYKDNKNFDDQIINKFRHKTFSNNTIVSLGEIITVYSRLSVDLLYGIYKNDFFYYKVIKIEYEEYDSLISTANSQIKSISSNDSIENIINSFVINNQIEIEFINSNNYQTFKFIKDNIKLLNKSLTNSYINPVTEVEYFKKDYEIIHSFMKYETLSLFIIGPSHSGKSFILKVISDEYSMFYKRKDMNKFKNFQGIMNYVKRCEFFSPSIIHFKNSKRLNDLADVNQINELKIAINHIRKFKLFFIFSFDSVTEIGNNITALSDFKINYSHPDYLNREIIYKSCLKNLIINQKQIYNTNIKIPEENLYFSELSKLTVGFSVKDLKQLLRLNYENIVNQYTVDNQTIMANINKIKNIKPKVDKNISFIPDVKWNDVGGLENAKDDIYDTIQLPVKYPKLFENNLKRRSGLLLYGPPGSGKTLLAKVIANECSMNFISVKGPELLNMYVGESEKNIREVFEKARSNKPCVLFFDEIDALAPSRTKNSDQNNVMDRIVAQFMTEMDGIDKENNLIIIASTNRPDLVDSALLRPGRFDKMIYIGLPKSIDEKEKIFIAQSRKFSLTDDVNFRNLSELCPEDYSGADIYSVCSTAFTLAFKEYLKKNSNELKVSNEFFIKAINTINPSLPKSEIIRYEELKKKFNK